MDLDKIIFKKIVNIIVMSSTLALLTACGGSEPSGEPGKKPPLLTAETLGEQTVLSTAEYQALPKYAMASVEKGEAIAQICKACHTLEKGGVHMIGPNLHGFFGTAVASKEGFDYSEVLKSADFIWTPRAMDAWLAQPGRFLPGNRMSFAGVVTVEDRNNVIAYLLGATATDE